MNSENEDTQEPLKDHSKPRKKGKKKDILSNFAEVNLDDEEGDEGHASQQVSGAQVVPVSEGDGNTKSKSKKSKKKKKKEKNDDDDDKEDGWAALMAPRMPPKKLSEAGSAVGDSAEGGETVSKRKRNKKKKAVDKAPESVANDEESLSVVNQTNEQTVGDAECTPKAPEESVPKKKKRNKTKKSGQESVATTSAQPKKTSQALLNRMKGAIERKRQEEERKRQEEEAVKRALEEAEARERENERIAAELREKKKQEKKERLRKLKEEGKPVTKSQRENHMRLGQMLQSLKSQGVMLPSRENETGSKGRVVYKKLSRRPATGKELPPADLEPSVNKEGDHSNDSPSGKAETHPIELELDNANKYIPEDWETLADESLHEPRKSDAMHSKEDPKPDTNVSTVTGDDTVVAIGKRKKTLRAPVICVLGHVDTGKTKILDKLRLTNVQAGEAGGITQQIGVTNVGKGNLKECLNKLDYMKEFRYLLPGLLIIDTPGHESFRNLRSRGSSLCDLAILVVDIMHGMEQQTLESFQLLIKKKTPFVIALNKIDRLYEWKSHPELPVLQTLTQHQQQNTKHEFDDRFNMILAQFAEQGVNVALFNSVTDHKTHYAVVPTSAHTGDGIADLIGYLCNYSQSHLLKKLTKKDSCLEAVVMEVKSVVGLGMVVDVILINGVLTEGDTIVLSGVEGPIVTQIRAILTSQPMTDLRASKCNYSKHHQVSESQGIRVSAAGDIDKVIAGTPVLVVTPEYSLERCKGEALNNVESILNTIQTEEVGVHVQASTLGSLEALLDFLKTSKIPVAGVNIGPVHKKDILKASVMTQKDSMYAVVLAFDVKVEPEALVYAKKENVRVFTADIIYHLFDAFTQYTKQCKEALKENFKNQAVFPCKLRILPQFIFNTRDPIVVGVAVEEGSLRTGTPISVPSREFVHIGIVTSIELNHQNIDRAVKGQEVSVKIEPLSGDSPKMYGRHFDANDPLVSRESIDVLKDYFRDEMTKKDWQLILELKKTFSIV